MLTMSSVVSAPRPVHVMTKPIGPICNLDCKYCFYLEKEKLYPDQRRWKMSDELLESYIRQYIEAQPQDLDEISFAWQGGEPTLLGVGFFRRAVELQEKYANGRRVTNAFQTNGTLLDDEWCAFLAEHKFLVGLSIDGPRELHDFYRVEKKQKGSFDAVMRGLEVLKKHKVEFNTLTVVNRTNAARPLEVYRFLKEIGSTFLQFIPLVERSPQQTQLTIRGLDFAEPPHPGEQEHPPVTPFSVEPQQYGEFLVKIFDEWVRNDVGRTFVQLFDLALGQWMGLGSSLCYFAETCGAALAMESNGDLFSCDHYVYPRYRLGNIAETPLTELVSSPQQLKFGTDKRDTLPDYCRRCDVRFACNGECPKHRFLRTPDGEEGLNYLCAAYKRFFHHIDPYMKVMAQLVRGGQPADLIMTMLRQQERAQAARPGAAGRNDPCPCGSGKKYKKCCGR
jgi:uncharacterized protein